MKRGVVVSLAVILALFLGVNVAVAAKGGNPFDLVWKAITDLQNQIINIQLIPGPQGEVGPQGPKGEDGLDAPRGAGNIAFTYRNADGVNILTNDGQVWLGVMSYNESSTWDWINRSEYNPPISPLEIVDWKLDNFLDRAGDMWLNFFNESSLVDYCNTGEDTLSNIYGSCYITQTFTPAITYKITSIKGRFAIDGTPGTLTVEIQETTASKPNGSVLTSGMINADDFVDTAWHEIYLSPYSLIDGVLYAIVVKVSGDDPHLVRWSRDFVGGYTGGQYGTSDNAGVDWSMGASDMMFETYGTDIPYGFINIGSPPI